MDHFQSPRNQGKMESPDIVAGAGIPGQGRYILLYLRIVDRHIKESRFECYGCGVTVAVCSVLTELIEGRSLSDCDAITPDEIAVALDGIPPHKMDCAHYGVSALRNAVAKSAAVET